MPRKKKRKILKIIIGIGITVLIIPCFVIGPYMMRVQHFQADPSKGFYADFFLYVSPEARRTAQAGETATFLVQPNNSAINSDDEEVHRKDAWWMCFGRHWLANDLGVVLLVPAFLRPYEDWRIYTHALDRDVLTTARTDLSRLDLQLLAMVDHARTALAEEGVSTEEKFLLQGFSASGMFANRFTVLHPARVRAVAAGSPGGWPIAPSTHWNGEALPYPAGVIDLEELTGEPFDSLAYREVPQLIVMGALDDNDSVDFRDGWDEQPAALVDRLFGNDPLSRWEHAQLAYRKAGADVRFVLVDGVGHNRRKLQGHTTRFFTELLSHK